MNHRIMTHVILHRGNARRTLAALGAFAVLGILNAVAAAPEAATTATLAGTSATLRLAVSPQGDDANPGTPEQPFATIERARDELRRLRAAADTDDGTTRSLAAIVELAGGTYELARPLEFEAQDGSADVPGTLVIYRARAGETVRLSAGRGVRDWRLVEEPAVLARLDPAARGQVWQADLKAQGISDFEGINNARYYQSDPGLELFFRDEPMTLARYPNEGYLRIAQALDDNDQPTTGPATSLTGKIVCDDPRIARWQGEPGAWLHGFWQFDWLDRRIALAAVDSTSRTLSFASDRSYTMLRNQWFYAQNLLPELDSPGEWYLDRERGLLYFWPPAPLSDGAAVVSLVRDPIRVTGASSLSFEHLTIEAGRGTAITIKDGVLVRVVGCTIRNMGNWAVRITGGRYCGAFGCDVYQTGQGGIFLEGGDRATLTPAELSAENNHIHHTSRWDPVYQQGIVLWGVGNRAVHNLIDNVPHTAICFSGNDQTIDFNEIHSAVFQSNDAGAIYTSPPDETWTMRGHHIRNNYLHHIYGFEGKGCNGVYLDDCFSSAEIYGNLFQEMTNAILIGGGRDNKIVNNYFLNCTSAFQIDARGLGWAKKNVSDIAFPELETLPYKQMPWSGRYPELVGILEDEPLAPKGNVVVRNVCWGGPWGKVEAAAEPFIKIEDNLIDFDPKLTIAPPDGFKLAEDSAAHAKAIEPLPFAEIGVYASPDRASWPVKSELRPK